MLKVTHLSKSYPQRGSSKHIHILNDISFEVEQGEVCSFVGPSGSGKTTLLGLCAGLDAATSGTVELAGQVLTGMSQNELARFRNQNTGFVFQNFQLIPTLTALENTLAPLELRGGKPPVEEAKVLLDAVGLFHRLDHYPTELSGGEQQRVAIARSFINKPKIIFADEPTGNLDYETGQLIEKLLFQMNEKNGTTLVIVTHNLELAQRAHRMISLKGGSIADNVVMQEVDIKA